MGDFENIDSAERLQDFCAAIADEPRIAFDTEFIPENTFVPELCLVQVATDRKLAIIDPLAVEDLTPFWQLLIDPQREVVTHAGKEEMNFCLAQAGDLPARLFDVQTAAGFVGLGYPLSLGNLVAKVLDKEVSTNETRTDWSKRPLSTRQLQYALDDVRYLLAARDRLADQLDNRDRLPWLEAETAHMLANVRAADQVERFRKVSGSNRLSPRQLAVLRELYRCREQRARATNKPVRWILRDDLMVELARRQPVSADELKRTRGMGQIAGSRWSDDLLLAIRKGQQRPDEDRPQPAKKRETPDEQMVQKILAAALIQLSQTHAVAPSLLGSGEDLRQLIEFHAEGKPVRPNEKPPRLLTGWRAEVCGKYLSALIEGDTVFRIQPASEGFRLVFETSDPPA